MFTKSRHLIKDFCNKYKGAQQRLVYLTGDASNKYETHRDFTTDYMIIKDALELAQFKVVMRVPRKNPNINNRVNVVCSLIEHKKIVITDRAEFLINDLISNESDGKGSKSKVDPMQTHASDALDYIIWILYADKFYSNKLKQYTTTGG